MGIFSAAGSVIGTGMKAIGGIIGGIAAARRMRQVQNDIKDQMKENEQWYNKRYNEDATQRADAQRLLRLTEDRMRANNRQTAGTAAVMGGTDDAVARAKAASNEMLGDTVDKINAAGEARKSAIESSYLSRKESLRSQLNALRQGQAQNIAAAAQGVAGTGATLAQMWGKTDDLQTANS